MKEPILGHHQVLLLQWPQLLEQRVPVYMVDDLYQVSVAVKTDTKDKGKQQLTEDAERWEGTLKFISSRACPYYNEQAEF